MIYEVRKHINTHLAVFVFLSIYFFLISSIIFIDRVLAVAICIGVLFCLEKLTFSFNKWYEAVLFIIVNAYVALAVFGYDIFIMTDNYPIYFLSVFDFLLGFIWSCYLTQTMLTVLKQLSFTKLKSTKLTRFIYVKRWLILFFISLFLFLLWQIAYNPVVLSSDSFGYLNGWISGHYNTFRSPVYAFLLTVICTIAPAKPEVMWVAISQFIAFSALIATILMYIHSKWIEYKYVAICAAVLPFIPSFALHGIIIWSDLPCALSLLWLTYILVRLIDEVITKDTASKRQQISFCIQLCLALVLVYFMRSNSFLVYMITVPVLIVFFIIKKQWKLVITVAISGLAVLLIQFPGFNLLGVQADNRTVERKYWAGIHDIQSVYYDEGKLSDKTITLLKKHIIKLDEAGAKEAFDPFFAEHDFYQFDTLELPISDFISMYLDTLINNPAKTFKSILCRNSIYWTIDSKNKIWNINSTQIFSRDSGKRGLEAPELGVYRKENILTGVMDNYLKAMILPIPAIFVWRYGVWTVLLLVGMLNIVMQRRFIWLLPYVVVVAYLMTMLLANGWPEYRYGLAVFFISLFFTPVIAMHGKNSGAIKEKAGRSG